MGLVMLESFDDDSARGGTGVGNVANGRTGRGMSSWLLTDIPAAFHSDTVTFGVAIRNTASTPQIVVANLSGPNSASAQWTVQTDRSMKFNAINGTQLVSPALLVPLNEWFYLEAQVFQAEAPNGWVTTRINGVVVPSLTATGIDTKTTATSGPFDQITLNSVGGGAAGVDDFYLMTGAGDSFLGDIIVETLYPNANGAVNAWQGSDLDSVDNYTLVDESPQNVNDWVGSSTLGAQDLYRLSDPTGSTPVVALSHQIMAHRSDATARSIKALTRSGGTTVASPAYALGTGIAAVWHGMLVNPVTGVAFTNSEITELEIGVEVA